MTVTIEGREVLIEHIEEIYDDGLVWYASIYGESDTKIDAHTAYRIYELKPKIVSEEIKDWYQKAKNMDAFLEGDD